MKRILLAAVVLTSWISCGADNIVEVSVSHNKQEIQIGQHAPSEKSVYGDKGGDRYTEVCSFLNPKAQGIILFKKLNKKACVVIENIDKIPQVGGLSIKFYYAVNKPKEDGSDDWYPKNWKNRKPNDRDSVFTIKLVRDYSETPSAHQVVYSSVADKFQDDSIKKLREEIDELKEWKKDVSNKLGKKDHSNASLSLWIFLLLMIVLIVWIAIRGYRSEKTRKKSEKNSDLLKRVNALERESKQTALLLNKIKGVAPRTTETLTSEQVRNLVVQQVEQMQKQMKPTEKNGVNTSHPVAQQVDVKPKDATPERLDTHDVVPNFEDHSFSLAPTDQPIFRIYKEGEQYFYTLVENEDVRQQLVTGIASFGDFISYVPSGGQASRVTPVQPGRLIKKSDTKFVVDMNNKLKVVFE